MPLIQPALNPGCTFTVLQTKCQNFTWDTWGDPILPFATWSWYHWNLLVAQPGHETQCWIPPSHIWPSYCFWSIPGRILAQILNGLVGHVIWSYWHCALDAYYRRLFNPQTKWLERQEKVLQRKKKEWDVWTEVQIFSMCQSPVSPPGASANDQFSLIVPCPSVQTIFAEILSIKCKGAPETLACMSFHSLLAPQYLTTRVMFGLRLLVGATNVGWMHYVTREWQFSHWVTRGSFSWPQRQNLTLNPKVEFLTSAQETTARHPMWKSRMAKSESGSTRSIFFGPSSFRTAVLAVSNLTQTYGREVAGCLTWLALTVTMPLTDIRSLLCQWKRHLSDKWRVLKSTSKSFKWQIRHRCWSRDGSVAFDSPPCCEGHRFTSENNSSTTYRLSSCVRSMW